jgi:CheY-like chemotaxis protein
LSQNDRSGILPSVGQTVLVVDDDDAVREAMSDVLSLDGYTVLTAGDGDEALQRLAAAPRPCVALVDLVMPRVDGWELVQSIVSDPALRDVAIVCTTAGRESPPPGCDAVLLKPFDDVELVRVVRAAFERARGEASSLV